ncbi:MAG: DEAD/DEAH box helicase family protein, partial [Alphaproteobacteria bacterium]|nr:DEAD/DEAH box helicase family protein [Alphaproteobacteria bacterium]
MDLNNFAGQISGLLHASSGLLCAWLEETLPSIEERWWESMVLPALSYQQRQRAENQGYTNLGQLDLAALLRVMDQNWYPLSQRYNLTMQDRHFVKEMQTIRNRWAHVNVGGVDPDDAYRDVDTIQRLVTLLGGGKRLLEEIKSLKSKTLELNGIATHATAPKAPTQTPPKNDNQNAGMSFEIRVGSIVALKSSPERQGAIIALEGREPSSRCTVFIDGKPQPFYLSQLQPVQEPQEKNLVSLPELHSLLTCMQVNHPSMATLYSLNAARIDFVPYQFRPALKIIQADQPRILIADGVGVGKTIEAGLIMRELQARHEINSVLIICPKPLVAERKWEVEMKRFDERFTQLDGKGLRMCIEEAQVEGDWPEQHKKTIIPYSLFDEKNLHGDGDGRKKRRGLLSLDPPPRFDLVIVDEAHHIRNSSTYAHQAVQLFCEHAEAVVFLTATPIQLGNQDLFTLLSVLRPDLVIDSESFNHMTEPNRFVNQAVKEARSGGEQWQENAISVLTEAANTSWGQAILAGNPNFQQAMRLLSEQSLSREDRVSMIGTIESFHSLSRIINRTRRRDIGTFCIRRPETVEIPFTKDQQALHDKVLEFEAQALTALHGTQNVKFMMSTIRRQTASCIFGLAPFIRDILERRLSELDWLEAGGEEYQQDMSDNFINALRDQAEDIAHLAQSLPDDDPKFDALAKIIFQKQRQDNNKIIIFSSFRHTLSYLENKLRAQNIRLAVVHGDVKDEDRILLRERFELDKEYPDSIDVMLFSEVGCEGLDYQFCDTMLNYDLPWNPMKIEQRIGRIDRRGQKSEAVSIFNFITPGTVDADIYMRCLQRIGVFEESIGDCESILGEISREIQNIGENLELTPSERQEKLEQLADNEIRIIQEQRQLEDREFELFGLRLPQDQAENEVRKAESYWLTAFSLRRFIDCYLAKRLGKGDYILGDGPLKKLRLSQDARRTLLDDFQKLPQKKAPTYQAWKTWLKENEQHLPITFDSLTAADQRSATFITPIHPLVLQAASFMEMAEPVYTGMRISDTNLKPGDYPFAIYAWEFKGMRSELRLVPVCSDKNLQDDFLDYLEGGVSFEPNEDNFEDQVFSDLDKDHHNVWSAEKERHLKDTLEMCAYRRESLKISHNGRINLLNRQLEKADNDNIRRMKQAQISN